VSPLSDPAAARRMFNVGAAIRVSGRVKYLILRVKVRNSSIIVLTQVILRRVEAEFVVSVIYDKAEC
jgi:hypothetical protein